MSNHLRSILRVLLTLALVFIVLCQAALADTSCYINTSTKVYKQQSASADFWKMPRSTTCTFQSMDGAWATVVRGGTTGYIPIRYLTLNSNIMVYATASTYLYKTASTTTKLALITKGTKLEAAVIKGSYMYVKDSNTGKVGFVRIADLSSTKPSGSALASRTDDDNGSSEEESGSETSNNAKIAQVLSVAESLLGRPYTSPSRPPASFDCSGFVLYCYKQVGITLQDTAYRQGYDSTYTKITSINDLKPGDVLCFHTSNDYDASAVNHVGIYIGGADKEYIHASSAKGKVIVSSLTWTWNAAHFSWARRILP